MNPGIEQRLETKGIKPTAMRNLVLDYLSKQLSAVSLTEVERALAPVDRITVYRTLKTFEERCLVHSIDDGTGSPRYALCKEDCDESPHHDLHTHFHCNQCNETYCLPKTLIPSITLPDGFKQDEMSLLVKGLCQKCSM
ncbi:transcriptional repressor [Daejeonella sp.]|uniref:Fur family transcriptional regulator n=1 Tax=Daejeonella sp. TaxID=2805397 RepID=UPI0030C3684B